MSGGGVRCGTGRPGTCGSTATPSPTRDRTIQRRSGSPICDHRMRDYCGAVFLFTLSSKTRSVGPDTRVTRGSSRALQQLRRVTRHNGSRGMSAPYSIEHMQHPEDTGRRNRTRSRLKLIPLAGVHSSYGALSLCPAHNLSRLPSRRRRLCRSRSRADTRRAHSSHKPSRQQDWHGAH
jgi:hypothetical protein